LRDDEWPRGPGRREEEFIARELALFDELRGVSHVAELRITTRNIRSLKQRYYPRNPAMEHVIDTQIDELLREDGIDGITVHIVLPLCCLRRSRVIQYPMLIIIYSKGYGKHNISRP